MHQPCRGGGVRVDLEECVSKRWSEVVVTMKAKPKLIEVV